MVDDVVHAQKQSEQQSVGSALMKLFTGGGSDEDSTRPEGGANPDHAATVSRHGTGRGTVLNYHDIITKCSKSKKLWEDKDFPADAKSLYLSGNGRQGIKWKRPNVSTLHSLAHYVLQFSFISEC